MQDSTQEHLNTTLDPLHLTAVVPFKVGQIMPLAPIMQGGLVA